jgi:hypothetical protein
MGDDWDDGDDWEASAANFKPVAAAAKPATLPAGATAGQAVLAAVSEPDASKFADEDQEEEPAPVEHSIKPQASSQKLEQSYSG